MPVVHPAEVWKESGRYSKIGPELVRFKDRAERDMVLAMTHEEVVAILLRDIVQSYRQLPMIVYHFQTKFRDEPRSRGGLIRVREFVMKDSYSCDLDDAGLDVSYRKHDAAYRDDLPAPRARRDRRPLRRRDHGRHRRPRVHGPQRVRRGHPRPVRQRATSPTTSRSRSVGKPAPEPEDLLPMEDVETPDATTIEALATFLGDPEVEDRQGGVLRHRRRPLRRRHRARRLRRQRDEARQHAQGPRRPPAGDGRGDQGPRDGGGLRLAARRPRRGGRRRRAGRPVAEPRRRREPGRLARQERQRAARLHARRRRRDHERPRGRSVPQVRLAGQAPEGDRGRQHLQARHGLHRAPSGRCTSARTASATRSSWARTASGSGGTSPASSRPTTTRRASPGPTRSRRTRRTSCRSALGATRTSSRRRSGSTRLAKDAGREILYDDRDESPGVKFTDAELLGMPWILTVSPRSLAAGGVEVTRRATGERRTAPLEEVEAFLRTGVFDGSRRPAPDGRARRVGGATRHAISSVDRGPRRSPCRRA